MESKYVVEFDAERRNVEPAFDHLCLPNQMQIGLDSAPNQATSLAVAPPGNFGLFLCLDPIDCGLAARASWNNNATAMHTIGNNNDCFLLTGRKILCTVPKQNINALPGNVWAKKGETPATSASLSARR